MMHGDWLLTPVVRRADCRPFHRTCLFTGGDGEDASGRREQSQPETHPPEVEGRLAGNPEEQDRASAYPGVEEFE